MQKRIRSDLEQCVLSRAIGIIFNNDERWLDFFYSHKGGDLRLAPEELIQEARCFSRGEQILIRVALELWSGANYVGISQIVEHLDWTNLTRVLVAIMTLRDITANELIEIGHLYHES